MRLEITQRAELALRVIQTLADGGAPRRKGGELAAAIGTTPTYIGQVVAPLVQAGWVQSDPGPTGGYRLTTDAASVSLLELVEALEGPTDNGRCVLRTGPCDPTGTPCAMHDAWVRARDALTDELARTPVSPFTSKGRTS